MIHWNFLILAIHWNFPLLMIHGNFPLLTVHGNFPLLTVHGNFPLLTVHGNFPLLTVHGNFPLLTVHGNFLILMIHCNFPQVMFVVWTCAYSCLGAALYGAATHNFSRLDLALTTVVGLLTGHNSVKDVELWERLGSQVFLVTFLIFAVGSLTAYVSTCF